MKSEADDGNGSGIVRRHPTSRFGGLANVTLASDQSFLMKSHTVNVVADNVDVVEEVWGRGHYCEHHVFHDHG